MLKKTQQTFNREDYLLRDLSRLSGKIGILGGSFDPVHLDHIGMAEAVKKSLNLDYIVFLPTPHNPLKGSHFFNTEDRVELLIHAVAENKNLYVSTLEIDDAGNTGKESARTVDTLDLINANKNPKAEIYFILGADCLLDLYRWKDFHELFKKVIIVPVQRGQDKNSIIEKLKDQAQLTLDEINSLNSYWVNYETMNFGGDPISSTEIRKQLDGGQIPVDFLPPLVSDYLSDNF